MPDGTAVGGQGAANYCIADGTAITAQATNTIWTNWTTASTTSNLYTMSSPTASATVWSVWVESEEAKRERHEREAQREARWQEEAKVARAAARKANETAKQLLLDHLTPEQRKTFEDRGWFVVEGGKSKKPYRIETKMGFHGNVVELKDHPKGRQDIARYCFQLHDTRIPHFDHILAQKLALECDEENILKLANRSAA